MKTSAVKTESCSVHPRNNGVQRAKSKRLKQPVMYVGLIALVCALTALFVQGSFGQNKTDQKKQGNSQSPSSGEREVMRARADIKGEGINGTADFVEIERGTERLVRVTVRVNGAGSKLTEGLRGVHLHEKGVCEAPFTSAGGHFDPGPASNPDPDVNHPYHTGDLPNIRINADGSGVLEATTTRITLSDGPLSALDADGSAIMIHGQQDQLTSGPSKSGVSGGPRLACGVIKRQ